MVGRGLDVRRKKMVERDEDGRRKEMDGEGGRARGSGWWEEVWM